MRYIIEIWADSSGVYTNFASKGKITATSPHIKSKLEPWCTGNIRLSGLHRFDTLVFDWICPLPLARISHRMTSVDLDKPYKRPVPFHRVMPEIWSDPPTNLPGANLNSAGTKLARRGNAREGIHKTGLLPTSVVISNRFQLLLDRLSTVMCCLCVVICW